MIYMAVRIIVLGWILLYTARYAKLVWNDHNRVGGFSVYLLGLIILIVSIYVEWKVFHI